MDVKSLNQNWTVEYFEPDVDGFEMAPSTNTVPRLPDWQCSARFAQAGFYAWLQHVFTLEPTDECVRYIVQVENAPPSTRAYVNDQYIGSGGETVLREDITDYVALGQNRLSFRVSCVADSHRRFEAAYLLQQPCNGS